MNKKTSQTTSFKKFKPLAVTASNGLGRDEKDDNSRKRQLTRSECSQKVVLLDPNSSFSPTEKVFSIDHIMKSIFSKLDVETLRNCRLVSRRWAHFGAKALQNLVNIYLCRSRSSDSGFLFTSKNAENAIPFLFDLINNSSEFPCNSFTFHTGCYNKMEIPTHLLEPFFNMQACRIEKIGLDGYFYKENLKQLILTLALNVKELILGRVFFYYESERNKEPKNPHKEEPSNQSPSRKAKTLIEGPALKNLRVFKSWNCIPDDIVHQILESSPNLVEVSLDHENLHCLVKPRNLLHLVTKLRIFITDPVTNSLEVVANNHQNNFAVEEFEFGGHGEYFDKPEPPKRYMDSLDKILRGCSASCTKLVFLNTLQDFQIPRMPQVKHLRFTYQENYSTGRPLKMLFQGVSLQSTFPSLESLRIDRYGYCEDEPHPPIENIFGGPHPHPPATNVKNVTLLMPYVDDSVRQSFREMFPNAAIHTERS